MNECSELQSVKTLCEFRNAWECKVGFHSWKGNSALDRDILWKIHNLWKVRVNGVGEDTLFFFFFQVNYFCPLIWTFFAQRKTQMYILSEVKTEQLIKSWLGWQESLPQLGIINAEEEGHGWLAGRTLWRVGAPTSAHPHTHTRINLMYWTSLLHIRPFSLISSYIGHVSSREEK